MPFGFNVTVPLVTGTVSPGSTAWPSICVTVNVSPSTSVSLSSTGIVTGVSSGVVRRSSTASGASFSPVTVIVSVVVSVRPPGSVTV